MSPDQYAELEALRDDMAYENWVNEVTDPELHRPHTRTCRMCGKTCPVGWMRGNVCVDCETMAGELLDPQLKL